MSDAVQRAPYAVSPPRYSVSHQMVTTAFELPNYRIVQNLGVVRGIVVRSRNVFATLGATLQVIVGGNITVWTKLCEQTREDAFDIMIQHTPPGETEIYQVKLKGCRYLGDSDDMKEGNEPDKIELTLNPIEIVNIINGKEVVLL